MGGTPPPVLPSFFVDRTSHVSGRRYRSVIAEPWWIWILTQTVDSRWGEHLERKKGQSAFCTPLFRFKCCDSEKLVSDVGPISSPLYLSDCESYINFLLIDGNRRPCPAIVSANKSRMADRL